MIIIGNKNIIFPGYSAIYAGGKKFYGLTEDVANQYYVSTDGTPLGDGSPSNPWDLETALTHPPEVNPGDTIYIRGGKYVGEFTSRLTGTKDKIIRVRPYNNELVFIVGSLNIFGNPSLDIYGDYCYFYDIHATNGDKVSEPIGINEGSDGIRMMAPNSKIINCIVHDNGGNGISFWTPAVNSEVYGCVMYNNGWRETLEGHNIYVTNFDGTKTIKHNIIFNSAGFGIHAYSEGQENLWVQNVDILQNVCFNNGILNGYKLERSIIVGSIGNPSKDINVNGNIVYHKAPTGFTLTGAINLGYEVDSKNAVAEDNYVYGGSSSIKLLTAWESFISKRNTLINNNVTFLTNNKTYTGYDFDDNKYYLGTIDGNTFVQWQALGFDVNGSYSSQLPQQNVIFIHPNEYEGGRANITIWNWENKNFINIDVSLFLNAGDDYYVYDVQKFASGPILQGKITGNTVTIPMNNTETDPAFGNEPVVYNPTHTDNEFISLIIAKRIITGQEPIGVYPLKFNGINTYLQLTERITTASYYEIELTLDEITGRTYFIGDSIYSPAIGYNSVTEIRLQGTVGNKIITPIISEGGFINFKFEKIGVTNAWNIIINDTLIDVADNIGDIPFQYIGRRRDGNFYLGQIKKFLVKNSTNDIIFDGDFNNISGRVLINKANNGIGCGLKNDVKWRFLPDESFVTPITLTSIAITPTTSNIDENSTQQFTAIGTYSDNSTFNITSLVVWSSNNNNIIINSSGLAIGIIVGSSIISATLSGITGTANITVNVAPTILNSITITPANSTINVGDTQQFTAVGTYNDNSTVNITSSVTWGSNNNNVTIDSMGLTTGVMTGTSIITAVLDSITGTTLINVNSVVIALNSIEIKPYNSNIIEGNVQQFIATGNYSNGSKSNITSSVTWGSSSEEIIIINTSTGLATAILSGTSTIIAALNGISGTTLTTVIAVVPEPPIVGDYHVTVNGSDSMTSQGTLEDPWSLWRATYEIQTRYKQPQAGETVLMHAGNYVIPQTGVWSNATPENPITYRAARDGLVTLTGIDGGIVIHTMGGYIHFQDLIVTCTNRNRVGVSSEGDPYDRNNITGQIGIGSSFPGAKFINCIVHDNVGNGISASGDGTDTEYYGNIIFNNGFYISNDREPGKSHGMYMSNNAGTRVIENNILFNSYGHGIQFYTEAMQQLAGLDIFKNTIFNSGGNAESDGYGTMRNFMIGGNSPLKDIFLDGNISYFAPNSLRGTHIQLGYNNDGENVSVFNTHVMGGGSTFIHPLRIKNVTVRNNTIIPAANNTTPLMQIVYPEKNPIETYDIDNNTYYSDRTGDVFKTGYVTDYTFTEWKAAGYDVNSVIKALSTLTTMIIIYPNKYENGRAHITILNHLELTNVMVDLSTIYNTGDTYYMYDVQDMDNAMGPFIYDGELISFPMNLTSVKQSVGNPGTGFVIPHTPISFGCFIVVKRQIF